VTVPPVPCEPPLTQLTDSRGCLGKGEAPTVSPVAGATGLTITNLTCTRCVLQCMLNVGDCAKLSAWRFTAVGGAEL